MSNCDVGSPDCTILKYLNHTTAEKVFPHLLPFPPYVAVWRVPRSSLLKFGRPNMIFSPCKCTLTLIFGIWIWLKCSFWRKWHKVVDIRESITNKWPLTQHIGTKKQNMRTSYTKILSQGHSNVKYLVCIWILQPLRTHFFEVPKRMTSPNTQCIYIYIFLTSNAVGTCCFSQHVFSFCPPKNHWPKRPFAVLFSSRDHVDQGRFLPTKDHDLRQRPWERSLPHFHHGNPSGTRC